MNLIPIKKNMTQETKWIRTWEVFLITSSKVGPMVPILWLLCLHLIWHFHALKGILQRNFAKEATPKSPLHFLGLQWQLPPYYLLTFERFQGKWLDYGRIKWLVTFLEFPRGLGVSKGTWRFRTWFWSWFTWWWKHAGKNTSGKFPIVFLMDRDNDKSVHKTWENSISIFDVSTFLNMCWRC